MGFSGSPVGAIVYEYVEGGSLYDRLHKVCTKYFAMNVLCIYQSLHHRVAKLIFSGKRGREF